MDLLPPPSRRHPALTLEQYERLVEQAHLARNRAIGALFRVTFTALTRYARQGFGRIAAASPAASPVAPPESPRSHPR